MICYPMIKDMHYAFHKFFSNPIDQDEQNWLRCNRKCIGVCGDKGCGNFCHWKCNHKWTNNRKSQKVCWCGEIVEKDETDVLPPAMSPLPIPSVDAMEKTVKFRYCNRYGTVPALHYCDHCSQEEPRPLKGPQSMITRQTDTPSTPSSSESE